MMEKMFRQFSMLKKFLKKNLRIFFRILIFLFFEKKNIPCCKALKMVIYVYFYFGL